MIMISTSFGITYFRIKGSYTPQVNIILDIVLYIVIPFIINITSNKNNRWFEQYSVFNIVNTLTINIALYFCYLGLTYWSNLLNSLLPIDSMWLSASTMFLINFEVYIGLVTFMLSMNILIKKIKGDK